MRLDQFLVEKGYFSTREQAKRAIMAGEVVVQGRGGNIKPSLRVNESTQVNISHPPKFVSRGGLKLDGFLERADISVKGLSVLDIGSSTGGFTDCLLQRGVERVVALDVGKGLLHWRLRNDRRVFVLEGLNARYLKKEMLPFTPDLVTIDVSFISIKLILEPLRDILPENAKVIALIKPQFEAGRGKVGKGGIVRDIHVHFEVVGEVMSTCEKLGYRVAEFAPAFPRGSDGNLEYFLLLFRGRGGEYRENWRKIIEEAWELDA